MKRPSWNETFMNMAFEVAKRSTCARIKVGCVLVKDKRVVSMGYNGSAPGAMHCSDYFDELFETSFYKSYKSIDAFKKRDFFKGKHKTYADDHEIHAEMNAISFELMIVAARLSHGPRWFPVRGNTPVPSALISINAIVPSGQWWFPTCCHEE